MKKRTKIIIVLIVSLVLPVLLITGGMAGDIQNKYEIVIDPAHGGSDEGVKLTRSVFEKDVTLAIAKLIKKNLDKTKNIKVKLTRSGDADVSEKERKKMVDTTKTDLFVSLHVNAGFGIESTGYEIYYSASGKSLSAGRDSNEIVEDMIESRYINDSILFAQLAQRNIEKIFPREGRGIRSASVLILEGLSVPAVVIEMGFATNVKNRKKITDKKEQEKIAAGLSKSIRDFFSN